MKVMLGTVEVKNLNLKVPNEINIVEADTFENQ